MRKNLVGSTNFCGFRDQNSHRFRDQGSNFWVKIWDHLRKNIPRYDPVNCHFLDVVMVPRPLAPTRAMRSRTCAHVIQPCRWHENGKCADESILITEGKEGLQGAEESYLTVFPVKFTVQL